MQELSTILAIAFAIILIATTFVILRMLRRRSHQNEMRVSHLEINLPSSQSEINSSNPQTDSPESFTDIVHTTAANGYQIRPQREMGSILTNDPIPTLLDTPNSILIENEQGRKEETNRDTENENLEPPVILLPETTENLPTEISPQVVETMPVLNDVEKPFADEPLPTKNQRKLSPENRGGARRGQRKTDTRETSLEQIQRTHKPEVVCWQKSRKWFIGIEIPDEYTNLTDCVVMQGNNKLSKETDWRWILFDINNDVEVSSQSLPKNFEVLLAEHQNPYLLFKLTGQLQNWGRRVRYATKGTDLPPNDVPMIS